MIFIQGADGFLGSAIYKTLKKNKYTVKKVTKKKFHYKSCEIFINCSTNSKKYLSKVNNFYEFNNSIKNIKQSIINFKFKKYILISTCEVYGNQKNNSEKSNIDYKSLSNYGFYKYLCEMMIMKETKKWLILRCNGLIGENLKKGPIYDIMNNKKVWANPKSRYQLIDTQNVAQIIAGLIKSKVSNQIYNIASNDNESIENISKNIGVTSKYKKNLPKIIYNINNNKIKKKFPIFSTNDYIQKMLSKKNS